MLPGHFGKHKGTAALAGVALGYLVVYVLHFLFQSTSNQTSSENIQRLGSRDFDMKSPHSHGELNQMLGPTHEAQAWNDFDDESHQHEEDTVASELKKKVRILCWVMTSPDSISSKARHVKATWGRRCNVLLFMSSQSEPTLPTIGLDVPEGYENLWGKTKAAFRYVHEHHLQDADWFLKADDDTYAVIENLRHLLKDKNPEMPIYFGRRFKPYVRQGYMSGGAGYILSRNALKRFVTLALDDPSRCLQGFAGTEDVEMGTCMQNSGVAAGDSRDQEGKERFHPFPPSYHLIPGAIEGSNWLWSYSYYPLKEGPDCCSDYSVTFHYVSPNLMYLYEYLVYHMKPYGISSNLILGQQLLSKYSEDMNHRPNAKLTLARFNQSAEKTYSRRKNSIEEDPLTIES